jgi:serine/threonine-protein kinase RsbW
VGGDEPTTYHAAVPADPDSLALLHDLIERARRDWPDVAASDFDLLETAVIEIAANVARHGRGSGATDVTLTVSVFEDALEATLVDGGRPLDVDLRAAELPPDLAESGRGIALVRNAVDSVAYEHDERGNVWRLHRRRR